MFLSRWKLNKLVDQKENLINHLLYNISFSGKLGFSRYRLFLPSVMTPAS